VLLGTGAILALSLLAPGPGARAGALPGLILTGAPTPAPEGSPDLELREPGEPEPAPPPRSYWLPVLEIAGWNLIQNRWSYYAGNRKVYDIGASTWERNLRNWWWDQDTFTTNQLAHPYMGSLYFNMARASGLSFWEGFGYSFGGSLMWELLGETEPPAFDDQMTTWWGGTVIGEILFRLSNRLLDAGGASPGFWYELGALVLNPAQGFNRILFGNRYRPADLGQEPFYAEFRAAAGAASTKEGNVATNPGPLLSAGIRVVNGGPGTGWRFQKPFDHFDATFGLVLNRSPLRSPTFTMLMLRGAVAAASYGSGTSSGLWGLYFNYDYISPAVYRASSSNLGLGTTAQVDWGSWAFQGHGLLGLGFGAGGSSAALGARDYHFGGQAVLQLEGTLFYRDRLRFRLNNRAYFTSGRLSDQHRAFEDIEYSVLSADWRVAGAHAIGIETVGARRRATYPGAPNVDYRLASLVILYEFLSDPGMGRGR
jgi:hypothetical protein